MLAETSISPTTPPRLSGRPCPPASTGPQRRRPAVVDVLPVSLDESRRSDDAPVVGASHTDAIAGFVSGRHHVLGEPGRAFEHAVDQLDIDVVATERAIMRLGTQHFM